MLYYSILGIFRLRLDLMIFVVDLLLYGNRGTFRVLLPVKLKAVPSVVPETKQFLGRLHAEIAAVILSPGRVAVVPLAVYLDVVPVMLGNLVRPSRDEHILNARNIEHDFHA